MKHLQDIAVRLQVYLERLKSAEFKDFNTIIPTVEKEVRDELASGELTDFSKAQMNRLIKRVRETLGDAMDDTVDEFVEQLKEISAYSHELEATSLETAIAGISVTTLGTKELWSNVLDRPMSSTGELLQPWITRMTQTEILAVESLLRRAYAESWTNAQTTRALRGTKALNYTDGLLTRMGRQNSTIVRTSIQHVNAVAREQLWQENSDIIDGYRWVSTLDNRTSEECRGLDGKVFQLGKGPMPPIHPNCRSTTIAVVSSDFDFLDKGATRAAQGGPVDASMTYYEWLKQQSADFQDSVIGPARGALLRNGGLTVEEFTRLQLNSHFQPLTLEQMRKLAPLAFQRAGI